MVLEIGATFWKRLPGFYPRHLTSAVSPAAAAAAATVASVPSMALRSRLAVALLCGWSYLCVGYCAMLKTTDALGERRRLDFTHAADKSQPAKDERELLSQDTMTEHMQMLYAKYNQDGFPFKDGNTVRSFKAHWGRWARAFCASLL